MVWLTEKYEKNEKFSIIILLFQTIVVVVVSRVVVRYGGSSSLKSVIFVNFMRENQLF